MEPTTATEVLEKELTQELNDEIKVDDVKMDNEGIHVNITLRGKLYNLVKENLLYFHTKLTKFMSCTTNTVEKIYEPVEVEKLEVKVDEPVVVVAEEPVVAEEHNVNKVQIEGIEEPVAVEKPISVEERN